MDRGIDADGLMAATIGQDEEINRCIENDDHTKKLALCHSQAASKRTEAVRASPAQDQLLDDRGVIRWFLRVTAHDTQRRIASQAGMAEHANDFAVPRFS